MHDDMYLHFKEIIHLQTGGVNFGYGIIYFWFAVIEAHRGNYAFALNLLKNSQNLNLLFPFLSSRAGHYRNIWQEKLIERQNKTIDVSKSNQEACLPSSERISPMWPNGHFVRDEDDLLSELAFRAKEITNKIEILYAIGVYDPGKCSFYFNTFKRLKKIYFFVPVPEFSNQLRKTWEDDSRVEVFPYALTDKDGYDILTISNNDAGLKFHMGQQYEIISGKTISVECRTIGEIIKENHLLLPDMIIYDILGMGHRFLMSIPSEILNNIKINYFAVCQDVFHAEQSSPGEAISAEEKEFSFCGFSPLSNTNRTVGHVLFLNKEVAPLLAEKQKAQARILEKEIPESVLSKKPNRTSDDIDTQIDKIIEEQYESGVRLLADGNINEAVNAFISTLRMCSEHIMTLYSLGMIYWANKEMNKTSTYLATAFSLDPSNKTIGVSFAEFLIASSKHEQAKKVLSLCLQQNPGDEKLIKIELSLETEMKEIESFREVYKSIESLVKRGLLDDAVSALESLIKEFPVYALAHNDLGALNYRKGYKEKALKNYEEAVRLQPANSVFQKNLADFYYVELGHMEAALKIYIRLLDENPKDIETLLVLGQICVSLEKIDDAKVFYNKVLEIEPSNANAGERLDELEKGIDDSLNGGVVDWGRDGGRRTEDGDQESEVGGQTADIRGQGRDIDDSLNGGVVDWEYELRKWTEDGGRTTESRGQRTEDGGQRPKLQEERGIEPPEKLYQTAQGFMEGGKEKEAIGALKVFLGLYPDYALGHNDLGVLYYNEGNKENALKHYEQAAQLEPNNLTFQKNLADIYYFELERIEEALKIYNAILDENPEDLEVLLVMGHICVKLDKIDDAIDFYNRILEIDSGNEGAIEMLRQIRKTAAQFFLDKSQEDLSEHYIHEYSSTHRKILAGNLKDCPLSEDEQEFLDAFTAKTNSVEKSPAAIPSLLALMLYYHPHQLPIEIDILEMPDWLQEDYCAFLLSYPRCFMKQGEVDHYCRYIKKVFASFYKSIQDAPDSKTLQKLAAIITQKAYFIPLYFSKENLKDIYHHRAAIAGVSLKTQGYALDFAFPPRSEKRKKLRLGIYSKVIAPGTEAFATLPVYEYLNREEFEVFLYVHQQNGNPVETHARQLADKFIELPENMKTSVEIIRADDLDVLFFSNNLTAVMNHAFILANHRLAHFQCVHFCQPVSSGLKHIDYFFLGDVIQEKGKEDKRYNEQIVNLDGSGICFDLGNSDAQPVAAMSREQIGIPDNSLVFVSGANFFKIIPELRHLWAKLLAKVPESVLVLYPFGPEWPSSYPKTVFRGHFERACSKYDVKEDRLIILDPLPTREDIKELLRITDVYLDAVPYSGATSLLDPLEVGVPPVVMEGKELRCRQGAAILNELGVKELVVKSEEGYLDLAARLATNIRFRTNLREKILNKMQDMPPFLDPKGYAEKIGAALKDIVDP